MPLKKTILSFIACIGCLTACQLSEKQHTTTVQRAFYYWQNELATTDIDTSFIAKTHLQRLYIRLMDIDLDAQGQATPLSKAKINWSAVPHDVEVVPVIYIRNKVFQAKNLNNGLFAEQLTQYIRTETAGRQIKEIQFDCDWSATTRKAYFDFLNQFKKAINTTPDAVALSATIRLHQIKYRDKTGIPPVERGALMLYNMDDVTKSSTKNSIFDPSVCDQYLSKQKPYLLPLDIALPLFSWGVVFRQNQYKALLNGLTTEGVSKSGFLKKTDNTHYEVQQDTVFEGVYLRLGDDIRLEDLRQHDLLAAVERAKKMINSDTTRIIFYHFDKKILNRYDEKTFETIYNSFN